MNRQIIVFDTTTGNILRVIGIHPTWDVVCEGDGTIDGQKLTGEGGFSAIDQSKTITVESIIKDNGRRIRCGFREVLSDTELTITRTPINCEVTYKVLMRGDPPIPSDSDKNAAINEIKAEFDHNNVDAIKIQTDTGIMAGNYYIDITDGNKVKKRDERIVYE